MNQSLLLKGKSRLRSSQALMITMQRSAGCDCEPSPLLSALCPAGSDFRLSQRNDNRDKGPAMPSFLKETLAACLIVFRDSQAFGTSLGRGMEGKPGQWQSELLMPEEGSCWLSGELET